MTRLTASWGMVLLLVVPGAAFAQNNRSAVSVNGLDSNNCTVPAPCRTFGAAIAVTNSGGDIIALDSGGYGPFTINKAVSVQAIPGAYAGIAPTSGTAISINAGPSDVVRIRGLNIVNLGSAFTGIDFNSGRELHVLGCTISNFTNEGIEFLTSATANLYVTDTFLHDNNLNVYIETTSGTAEALIVRTQSTSSANGFRADDNSRVTIVDSAAVDNFYGYVANCGGTSTCEMNLESSVAMGNSNTGVTAGSVGGTSTIRVSNCTVTNNANGVSAGAGQNLLTRNNNTVEGNAANGTFTGSFTAK